jgi:hypothetical protein
MMVSEVLILVGEVRVKLSEIFMVARGVGMKVL